MEEASIDKVIEEFSHLPLEDKEYVLDIIAKQTIEARRDGLAFRASEAMSNCAKGTVKKGSLADLREDLEGD